MSKFKEPPEPGSQRRLVPLSLDEATADAMDVRLLSEVMDRLDWRGLESGYSELGCRAYPPKMMAKVLVYAYLKGVRSSRKIAEMVRYDNRMIWLAGGLRPDFHTLARFRREKFEELGELFRDSIRLCQEAGLVVMRQVAVDGTKLRANASRKSLYDGKRVERERAYVERVLAEAEATDAEEDGVLGAGDGTPEELRDPKRRKEKLDEIERRLKESKKKHISSSDPDSRLIQTSSGIRPSYNVQAAVDADQQVIVGAYVTQSESDHGQLPAMLEEVEANTGAKADVVLADSGYSDQRTQAALAERGQEALIPPREQPRRQQRDDGYGSQCFAYDEERDVCICPQGRELRRRRELTHNGREYVVYEGVGCRECGARGECIRDRHHRRRQLWRQVMAQSRERMKERLRSAEGRALYAVRGRTVEPVFGQMKGSRRFDRLLLRGLRGARAEVALMCLAHNVMKCARQASAALRALLSFTRSPGRVIGGASRPSGAKIASLPAGRRQSLTIPLPVAF
jgi:transposase